MTKMEEEVSKREAVSPPISQNLNKQAKLSIDNRKASSFGATHKVKDLQVQVSNLDSTYKSPATSTVSGVEGIFMDCKPFQEKYKVTRKLGKGSGGTVYEGKVLFIAWNKQLLVVKSLLTSFLILCHRSML